MHTTPPNFVNPKPKKKYRNCFHQYQTVCSVCKKPFAFMKRGYNPPTTCKKCLKLKAEKQESKVLVGFKKLFWWSNNG